MKTPCRDRATVVKFATVQDCYNARTRYKRKNRTRQLKNTISRLHKEIKELDASRRILRNFLISTRNLLLSDARATEDIAEKHDLLKQTRPYNLLLSLSLTPKEIDLERQGKDPYPPDTIHLTQEEKLILTLTRNLEEHTTIEQEGEQ